MGEDAMVFIENWLHRHLRFAPFRPPEDSALATELADWLRKDAADIGISRAAIDAAIAGSKGTGSSLPDYIENAMLEAADLEGPGEQAPRLPEEDPAG